jgi:hypothetical protein
MTKHILCSQGEDDAYVRDFLLEGVELLNACIKMVCKYWIVINTEKLFKQYTFIYIGIYILKMSLGIRMSYTHCLGAWIYPFLLNENNFEIIQLESRMF